MLVVAANSASPWHATLTLLADGALTQTLPLLLGSWLPRLSVFAVANGATTRCSPRWLYRAIATRYDKTAVALLSTIHLAAAVAWLN